MFFTDIHTHTLYGVDDGAKTAADMQAMVDAAYSDGVRLLCVTPHFHPGYFGENASATDAAYEQLGAYIRQRYPELRLCRGNELRYSRECVSWLQSGRCHTLNDTQFVLVDFSEIEEAKVISHGLDQLLNAGYRPILAHVERYRALFGKIREIRGYRERGVLLQADTQSVLGGFGFQVRRQCRKLLAERLIDLVGSDGHNLTSRPPQMSPCFQYIRKKYGQDYAEAICCGNAMGILQNPAEEAYD